MNFTKFLEAMVAMATDALLLLATFAVIAIGVVTMLGVVGIIIELAK